MQTKIDDVEKSFGENRVLKKAGFTPCLAEMGQ